MKKFYYLMLVAFLPMLAMTFASCDDDNDLPNVDISLDVSKGVVYDNAIYVVQGDTIKIAEVQIVNNEAGKGAAVTNVNYFWDGLYYSPSVYAPYPMIFPTTENTALGNHEIGVTCTVLAVDKSIATAAVTYPVKVVASADDLPSVADGGQMIISTNLK